MNTYLVSVRTCFDETGGLFMDRLDEFFRDFQDHLAPRLDTYEQAIYLYAFRHTRFVGIDRAAIGFKSARSRMACGIGEKGRPMSEGTAYEKLRSLEVKGCIEVLDSTRSGRVIKVNLPSEIPGVVVHVEGVVELDIEEVDFFDVPENRARILLREGNRCFYCRRQIGSENYVIEHVVSRPLGDNSYRNLVAACRQCNNRKGSLSVDEWLRTLYRDGFLSDAEFRDRLSEVERLRAGELRPPELLA